MKKLFLLLAFFSCVSFAANAQSCSKTASAKKGCCAKTAAAAAKLASADDAIEAKTCSKSGKVTYYKNYTCSTSGKLTSTEVSYDADTKKFVNVSPSKMAQESAAGGKNVKATKAKKSCDPAACKKGAKACTKSAKAVKTSAAKKSCDPKNCDPSKCKKGAAKTAKLVKAEN